MLNPVKSHRCISSATTGVAPDLLKALAILSDTAARRPAVDREDLQPYWKSEKKEYLQVFYLEYQNLGDLYIFALLLDTS